jgi:hypothetical protein
MKKTKVENISAIKLDFFVKQGKEDVRIVLMPGESSWCDHGSTTKSMILYGRKGLIQSGDIVAPKITDALELAPVEPALSPPSEISYTDVISPLEKAVKETEEYKAASEKKYKGKKRGRKKKRGPKGGSKRKPKDSTETTA